MRDLFDTRKVALRPLIKSDFALVETWLNKDYIKKWLGDPEEWMAEIRNENGEHSYYTHFIVMYADISFGYCQYYDASKTPKGYEWDNEHGIGYFIGEENCLNKGLGDYIVQTVCQYAIEEVDPVQLFADPSLENVKSIRLLERNGFTFDLMTRLYKYPVKKLD